MAVLLNGMTHSRGKLSNVAWYYFVCKSDRSATCPCEHHLSFQRFDKTRTSDTFSPDRTRKLDRDYTTAEKAFYYTFLTMMLKALDWSLIGVITTDMFKTFYTPWLEKLFPCPCHTGYNRDTKVTTKTQYIRAATKHLYRVGFFFFFLLPHEINWFRLFRKCLLTASNQRGRVVLPRWDCSERTVVSLWREA